MTTGLTQIVLSSRVAVALLAALLASACSGGEGSEDAQDVGDEQAPEALEIVDVPPETDSVEAPAEDAQAEDAREEELPCPTFAEVQPIFTSSCASCHPGRDSYSYLTTNLSTIRMYVEGFHHIGGDDRTMVLRWIDCGAPP